MPPASLEPPAATPEHAAFLRSVHVAAEAAQAAPGFPADVVDRITRAGARFVRPAGADALAREVTAIAGAASIDLDVPTASRIPGAAGVKVGVKRLVGWYVNHLGTQVAQLGAAIVRFGNATAGEVARLDAEVAELRDELAQLRGDAPAAPEEPDAP